MPILEFKCPAGHITERLIEPHRVKSYPRTVVCGQCEGQVFALRQVSLPAAPQFKGSGFYATDYKGKP